MLQQSTGYFAVFVFRLVQDPPILSYRQQIYFILPFTLAQAGSLAFANVALIYLFPSFHSMLQNSTPIWTVLASKLLLSKRFNSSAYLALVPVCLGGAVCSFGEASHFAWFGVVASLLAAFLRAVRASLQGALLTIKTGGDGSGRTRSAVAVRAGPASEERGFGGVLAMLADLYATAPPPPDRKIDPLSMMYYTSPPQLAIFLVVSLFQEGLAPYWELVAMPVSGQLWLCFGSVCAGLFTLLSFAVLGRLGAVLMMVVGRRRPAAGRGAHDGRG